MCATPALAITPRTAPSTTQRSAPGATTTTIDPTSSRGVWDQKCVRATATTPGVARTSSTAARTAGSYCVGSRCISTSPACCSRGNVDSRMSTAMKTAAAGSAHTHPRHCTSAVETMTPTEPSVSARMCRNMARMLWSASAAAAVAAPPPMFALVGTGARRPLSVGGGFPRNNAPVSTSHAASSPVSGHPGARLRTSAPSSEKVTACPGYPANTCRCSPDSGSTTMISPSSPPMATCVHAGDRTISCALPWSSEHAPPLL
mmetsp:Transcript_18063/g.44771  ORF Transcript_18063/g.44771 Transcript_18063/m.44771 type:complete len:260 (-) Transcript_18063:653-1432(-)